MAFTSVGSLGTVNSITADQSTLVLTTSATLEKGNFGIVLIAVDNNQTTDGDEGAVSGVVDSVGNTWTKGAEFTNGQGGANAGATVSLWWCIPGTQLTSGGTVTATFTNVTARDKSAASAWEFTIGAGVSVAIEGTPGTLANDGADVGSLNVTTSNIACLRVRAIGHEGDTGTISVNTSGWTTITVSHAVGGTASSSMTVVGEFHISTGTGDASDPTLSDTTRDNASVYVAFKETNNPFVKTPNINQSVSRASFF